MMTGQADDVVALTEQSQNYAAAEHSAGAGDGDPHRLTSNPIRLVVVVQEGGVDQIIEIHSGEVFFPDLIGIGAGSLIRQVE